ncbi:S9 family peptidase [Streptobacillus felis]|uniref:alpha/beta hydrolase family protein n=1 Tax=Streptobacillus felis TaxID=1384509 RepID=UPI000833B1A9|nr:S9 family peptidase [Streptobacillus felis]
MSKLDILTMNEFKYLSNIKSNKSEDKFLYILSKPNLDKNSYDKEIYMYDGKEHTFLAKEGNFDFLEDNLIYFIAKRDEEEKKDEINTNIYSLRLDKAGEAKKLFSFDFPVNSIYKISEDLYLLSVTYSLYNPEYYKLPKEEKEKYLKELKEKNFRQIVDEIPFWNDNGTYIDKKRTAIFKYIPSKNEIIPLTKLDGSIAYITSVDKENKKVLFIEEIFVNKSSMYNMLKEISLENDEIITLIDNNKYVISTAKYGKNNIYLLASDMKVLGINENSRMYKIDRNTKELTMYLGDDISYGNATGSDVRLGSNEYFKVNYETEEITFIATTEYMAELFKVNNGKLETISNKLGSVDGYTTLNNELYVLGYLDSKLCEIYRESDLKQITRYNEEVMKDKYVANPISIDFNSNGDAIKGFVLLPENFDKNKKYPAILDIHGGPKTVYGTIYYHEMQVWANRGYVVMFTNPHGSSGRGDAFSDIRGKYGTIDYEDLMTFVDVVLEKYTNIDKNNLAVTGGSYGGFMTNWITSHTNRFKVAATQRSISNWISMYGVSDIGYYFSDDQNAAKLPNKVGFEKIWNHSPLKYVENVVTPTLIIHSDEDYRCPIDQGYQWLTALKDKGIESKMVVFKGESHGLSRGGKPKARIERLTEITEWIEKYTK